jgi:hypothetical protein
MAARKDWFPASRDEQLVTALEDLAAPAETALATAKTGWPVPLATARCRELRPPNWPGRASRRCTRFLRIYQKGSGS